MKAKVIATACFTVLIGLMTLMNARAQNFIGIEKSILTFSAPIELPGMTAPAGTYVFKRPNPQSARIIQMFTGDEKKILATFLTVPTQRLELSGENVVTFKETAEGRTPAIHYWYYPGLMIGHEFVYPKEQALRIAARTHQKVLSTEGEITEASKVNEVEASAETAQVPEPAPTGQASAADSSSARGLGAAQTARAGRADETVGTTGQAESTQARNELPRTASPLALSGLLSLLSFGGIGMLRAFKK